MSNIKPIILILGKIIGIFVMAKLSENKKNLKWKYNNVRKRYLATLSIVIIIAVLSIFLTIFLINDPVGRDVFVYVLINSMWPVIPILTIVGCLAAFFISTKIPYKYLILKDGIELDYNFKGKKIIKWNEIRKVENDKSLKALIIHQQKTNRIVIISVDNKDRDYIFKMI